MITVGTRLGPYEIVAPLGAGGMGEVYRARDTRLSRDVAIKVLPEHLSAHPEVRARFEREAKTISSLNHPHICTLFDVGRDANTDYLVMELIEGETLAQRLVKGPLPTSEVLRLGAQIADALDRAHRAGVVHRDLKPGNVMLTKSGAKLMDFGLARSGGVNAGMSSSQQTLAHSPTIAQPLTAEGAIVGTFEYMAPEQLEGREADARSDIWGLGCVLYEMATGQRAFTANTRASLISTILRDTPRAMAELVPMSPPGLERLVAQCLAKDPEDRYQSSHDLRLQLLAVDLAPASQIQAASILSRRRPLLAWSVAAVALALAAFAFLRPLVRTPTNDAGRVRLSFQLPFDVRITLEEVGAVIAPDGRALAFVANDSTGMSKLWLRELDQLWPRALEGTERADQPFWSPDSRWLAFFADGKLKKVPAQGGLVETLADAPDPRGGSWGRLGTIVFAPLAMGPLLAVADDGTELRTVASPDSAGVEVGLRFPCFLPDGKRFTFVSLPRREGLFDVQLSSIDAPQRKLVMKSLAAPIYAEPGYLITLLGTRLVAQRFDARTGSIQGRPVTLGEGPSDAQHNGMCVASASNTGILAYVSAPRTDTRLMWIDRAGKDLGGVPLPAGRWSSVVISPDGKRAVLERRVNIADGDLWIVDLSTALCSRLTSTPPWSASNAVWSPDGRSVAFSGDTQGPFDIYLSSSDGGEQELLFASKALFKNLNSWTGNGQYIAFEQPSAQTGWDVWALPVAGDRVPFPVVRTRANEGSGVFSPDGKWIVINSDESGASEHYLQSFPDGRRRTPIPGTTVSGSRSAGRCWWAQDQRELLAFAAGSFRIVPVDLNGERLFGTPRRAFETSETILSAWPSSDLQRLLAIVPIDENADPSIVLDMNWTAALGEP